MANTRRQAARLWIDMQRVLGPATRTPYIPPSKWPCISALSENDILGLFQITKRHFKIFQGIKVQHQSLFLYTYAYLSALF